MSKWSYISLQGHDGWGDTMAQQVYNIMTENNFFINLFQDYLTTGYGRVKASKNLIERDAYIMTKNDPYELADEWQFMLDQGMRDRHGDKVTQYMMIDPDAFDFIEDPMIDEINGIITSAGCDRQKGRALEELYEYQYKHVENPDEKPN